MLTTSGTNVASSHAVFGRGINAIRILCIFSHFPPHFCATTTPLAPGREDFGVLKAPEPRPSLWTPHPPFTQILLPSARHLKEGLL